MARGPDTKANLIEAAAAEFGEAGFDGTNSNRIARRAGYAPQTFYRHFDDKVAIFLAVYARWSKSNRAEVTAAVSRIEAARTIVASHRGSLRFRRSLRQLAYEMPSVAAARCESREAQLADFGAALPDQDRPELAARLLMIERLADGIAEGEFADLGICETVALKQLAKLLTWIS